MTHCKQVSVLSCMHLQQAEEVKAQNHKIHHLLALVEEQQEAIKRLSSPQSSPRTPKSCNIKLRVQVRCHVGGDFSPNPGDCIH